MVLTNSTPTAALDWTDGLCNNGTCDPFENPAFEKFGSVLAKGMDNIGKHLPANWKKWAADPQNESTITYALASISAAGVAWAELH